MQKNKNYLAAGSVALVLGIAHAGSVQAADEAPAAKPRVVILCPECGVISDIRRIEKPLAPERNLLPNLASSPHVGIGAETRAVPLVSFGASGPQRVQREPTTRNVWEITVRYDNGQFGFVTYEIEPEMKIGDRVRHVENAFEVIPHPTR